MEAQLAAYRARRAKEHNATKTSLFSSLFHNKQSDTSGKQTKVQENTQSESSVSKESKVAAPSVPTHVTPTLDTTTSSYSSWWNLLLHPTFLKVALWIILWGLFIELEFGAVYFIVSSMYIIYANTRTGPSADGRLSAYSVFNPNYERLEGTFTAEQFEKELRYGAGAVH